MMPDVDLSRIHAATEGLSRLLLVLARALRRTPGRVELAGELAAARIHLDRLAEMVGADLVEEDREEILREVALCFQGYLPFPQPHPGPTPGAMFPAVPPGGPPAPGGRGVTLDVNSPEHDALMEEFGGMADLESQDVQVYTFPFTNREFLYFRAGYELGRKGEV